MDVWEGYFELLRCVHCGGPLRAPQSPDQYRGFPMVNREMVCTSCGKGYPLVENIPVMFIDENRTQLLLDAPAYDSRLLTARNKVKSLAHLTGDELGQFAETCAASPDALTWEMAFWEIWKQSDPALAEGRPEKIGQQLEQDSTAGGRGKFFDRVQRSCPDLPGKHLLNIGAGRDFLLELFLSAGCHVIEQDIVLESLLYLKRRGASFCICGDARKLPFQDEVFQLAVCFEVLHHIWPIEEPLKELLRTTSGHVHVVEPNRFALTRLPLCFPDPLKRRLKKLYSGDYSHSPYETPIDPGYFKDLVHKSHGEIVDFYYTRSSWISSQAEGLRAILRETNIFLALLFPLLSSHFVAIIQRLRVPK